MPKQPAVPISGTPIKLTFLIKTPTKKFTEVHWNNSVVDLENPLLNDDCNNLAIARCKSLPVDCKMLHWQLSKENVYRDAWPNAGGSLPKGLITDKDNQGNNTLPVYMSAGTQYRRTMFLGAIPDSVIGDDLYKPEENTIFKTWITSFLAILTGVDPGAPVGSAALAPNNQWGFLPRLVNDPTVPVVPIDFFTFASGKPDFTVVTTLAHGCSVGDVVQISKVQGANAQFPMNQLWVVQSTGTDTTMDLQGFPPSVIPADTGLSGGFLQRKVRTFQKYDGYAIGQPSARNRGNSIETPKGRHKVKYNIGWPG